MPRFPSQEWAVAFKDALNTSKNYAEAARNWEGDFYFVVTDIPGQGDPVTMYADLWHGQCRDAYIVDELDAHRPAFTMTAKLPTWRKVIEKKLDPIQGLLTRQLKLEGSMTTIMKNVKAATELVNSLSTIDTQFPA
ncbi:MAG: SCP2 sterol-binding domain-containing protein [Anaerolineae bacterium]|nr:SCP2 sterol-binding domain-containing protein [Anaerolineae bacterium]